METLADRIRGNAEEKGIEKGMEKGKLETAKELIKRGVDIVIIAESTGIPIEEIKKLAETIH